MGVPIEINVGGYSNTVPNESTLNVIRDVVRELEFIPGVSVRITHYENIPGWRFHISFAWEGKRFAAVVYGYGGGEIFFDNHNLCHCEELVTPIPMVACIKFDPESLRQKLTKFLLMAVEKEKARLQGICEKLEKKPQESRIAHSGGGTSN